MLLLVYFTQPSKLKLPTEIVSPGFHLACGAIVHSLAAGFLQIFNWPHLFNLFSFGLHAKISLILQKHQVQTGPFIKE